MAVTRAFMLRMPLTDVDAMTSGGSARSRAPGSIDTSERATCDDVAAAVESMRGRTSGGSGAGDRASGSNDARG